MLPATTHFISLCESHKPRVAAKVLERTSTYPDIPIIDCSPEIYIPSTSKAPSGRGITRQYAMFFEFDQPTEEKGAKRARVIAEGKDREIHTINKVE